MALIEDIWRTWRYGPGRVVSRRLGEGPHEARALAILMLGCALAWLAQWPRFRLEAVDARANGPDFGQLAGIGLFTWLMVLPLVFYLLAGLAHLASRALGGGAPPWTARLALFWAWLAAVPAGLLAGVSYGLSGPSLATNLLGLLWAVSFLAFWLAAHRAAARPAAGA